MDNTENKPSIIILPKSKKRKTRADYQSIGIPQKIGWMGESLPRYANLPTLWECQKGHRWETTFSQISRGIGCPHCSGIIPKTSEDYIQLANKSGFVWAEKEIPNNTNSKTDWICQKGHRFSSSYHNIGLNHCCPICTGRIKLAEDYKDLAERLDIFWADDKPPETSQIETRWMCKKGHSWESSWKKIKAYPACPACVQAQKNEKFLHLVSEKNGIRWVGETIPKTSKELTEWECDQHHRWKASTFSITHGKNCPTCKNDRQPSYKPITSQNCMDLAASRGFTWHPQKEITSRNKQMWECQSGHVWLASYQTIRIGSGCPFCLGVYRKTEQDYINLATKRGFQWVGNELPKDVHGKTTWKCSTGHTWETTFTHIRVGTSCPTCFQEKRKKR